ncbi:MAG TPA: hypothetical protein VFG31_08445, partial [Conexibacter sp.]|nr:hypothetical protein [Conexibacter sp.]
IRPGERVLRVAGTPVESSDGGGGGLLSLLEELFGGGAGSGAQSMDDVRASFAALSRYDGVYTQLGGRVTRLCRSPVVRIDGRTVIPVVVKRAQPRVHHRAIGRILETHG